MKKTLKEVYGSMVFDESTMKEKLSARTFAAWKECVRDRRCL